jgi:hypothetical protein
MLLLYPTVSDFIDISVHESIAERWQSVGWAALTDAEREIGCVYRLHWHLQHGGLPAVLVNLERDHLNAAVAGLRRLGASNAASLVAKAIGDPDPAAHDAIEADLARSEIAAIRLELPEAYAASHPDEFPGPRSLEELWQSMRARGVDEKPKRLLEFERVAESDARATDRRCAVCGQPVPKHKSKCRRCGRPYAAVLPGGPDVAKPADAADQAGG